MHKMYIGGVFMRMKKISSRIAFVFVIFGLLSLLFVIVFDKSFAYQLELYSESEVVNRLNYEVNNIILDVLSESDVSYGTVITTEQNDIGEITCIRADMLVVNKLKNSLDSRITEICASDEEYEAKIPVGNLVGGGLLYGKGFDITVKFRPIGIVNTRMTGKLHEAGINQTIYSISFDININAAVVYPFRYREIPIKIETIISETVIVGNVPEAYTYFNMEGEMSPEEIQGYIEDFKAE